MRIIGFFAIVVLVAWPWTAEAASGAPSVYRQINSVRRAHRLSTLTLSSRLSAVALQRARLMMATQKISHSIPGQPSTWAMVRNTGYTFTAGGEVIVANMSDARSVVRAWELSTTHRAILFGRKYNQVGVAQIQQKKGEKLMIITVAIFAYHPKNTP